MKNTMILPSIRDEMRYIAKSVRSLLYNYIKRNQNIFNTDYNKCVLVSYILPPINDTVDLTHSNSQESKVIAETFKSMNYNVDVYHYKYCDGPINYEKYDVIFGFGHPFDNSFYTECSTTRIYYATGAHVCFQNDAELNRISNLQERKGELLKPRRIVSETWSASTHLSDAMITLGDQFTVSTYKDFFDNTIFQIPVSAYNFHPKSSLERDIDDASDHFLWIGSSGLVHKGLDLLLDVFSGHTKKHLHICGPKEDDFFELYYEELFETENIHYHGWVDISSNEFKRIVEQCLFTIFPSCSEGGAGSVITAMKTGLIPITIKTASVHLGDFGFLIDDASISSIIGCVSEASNLSEDELEERSQKSFRYSTQIHSIDNYQEELTLALESILVK
jgi:hypothetical protein